MEEQYRAEIEALKEELAQIKLSTQTASQAVASSSSMGNLTRMPDFRELKEYVSTFDPKVPSCLAADIWVKSIDDTGDVYQWSSAVRLHCARLNLGGCAKLWLDSCPSAMRDWTTFKIEIVKGFPSKKNPIYYHNLLSSRKWKTGETVEEYVYEMMALGRKGGFDEETTVTYITSGLRQYVKRSGMALSKVSTVEQLLEELRWIDTVDTVAVTKVADTTPTVYSAQRKSESSAEVCFQCHQAGHIARRCPRVMCHLCKRDGHMRNECPNVGPKRDVKASTPRPIRVVDQKSAFVKNVLVGGVSMRALVDTGGKVSTIQEKFAKNIGEVKPSQKVLRGFGKKEINVTSKVCAELQVDGVSLPVELQVVPTWVQDTAVILGEDIIDSDGLVMVKRKGDVKFEWEAPQKQQRPPREPRHRDSSVESAIAHMYAIDIDSKVEAITEDQINSDGSDECNSRLCELITNYRDCFAVNMREMGRATSTEMKISLMSAEPVFVKPRKLEYARESVLTELVHELLEAGIIAETESPYNSQVVLVPKKNNEFRMAIDYRLLNSRTIKDKFPMPDIESCLQKLAGADMFITVDLYSGYYQIPLEPESQNYTAFSTVDGHYRFLRMPFGLANGCAVFQRAMNKIVEKLRKQKVIIVAYIDDLILWGASEEELLFKFERLLVALREEGFTINLKKSYFFMRRVEVLGFEVSAEGVRPGERKIKAVADFPVPETVHTVQQFLGLSGFFRRFVQDYSIIAEPLFRLLRKEAEFVWAIEQQRAFEKLKQLLVRRPVLVLYDPNAEVELHTDASSVGVAGILLQKVDEVWKPVSYFSKKNSKTEVNYHSYELEMLAVVASVDRFRQYLVGRFFVIRTDCSAVRDAYAKKEMNKRVARYFLKLLEYDFRIEHREGAKMLHVDALSRSPAEEPRETESVADSIMVLELSNSDFIVSMQRQDHRLLEVIDILARDPRCDEDRQVQQN
ncbi:uncharacterized protein LOC109401735 [Aedes albopictus]|uniref:Reverse transcriptase n=1 Tax=Aedes albopictus TaxID=7160 RepID=A0ABM2A2X8_AEDAL